MKFPKLTRHLGSLMFLLLAGYFPSLQAQDHSVARQWNEVLLNGIRNDFARPTVHARNLFHISAAMYDAWAVFEPNAATYFLGKQNHRFFIPFEGFETDLDVQAAREEAISYAAFRLIKYRFRNSPGAEETLAACDSLLLSLGYDPTFSNPNYQNGSPASLGLYLAEQIIAYGHQDGSNEEAGYANSFYQSVNPPLAPIALGNPRMIYPNRWQPLQLGLFVDQSGNPLNGGAPPFLGPEWGYVSPFAMNEDEITWKKHEDYWYPIYHDPGPPALMDTSSREPSFDYQWNHSLVALWSSHLDPNDGVIWDISPGNLGNISVEDLPTDIEDLPEFYDELNGGDIGTGYAVNPKTGAPYPPNLVPRGDYTRVLAEFWADGPDSETPPGHWFTILNHVNDQPELEKRFEGKGDILDPLEWDVKAYFILGGAVHDAAISAWSIKGYYDYVRPISAIRWMADQGQSTDPTQLNYSPYGIPLEPGLIEVIEVGDPLAGFRDSNVGKIKLYTWRGPAFIGLGQDSIAGVGWILAEQWWPYQRPSFVTPPFAGYISGHSTFSRAAAEVLTMLTGDPFFPGGVGEFVARKNEFLVFEKGPSVDVVLQWATYRDASDQTSLSRIWGGIHPPVDDIPGRLIGIEVGEAAFAHAKSYFDGTARSPRSEPSVTLYPNPLRNGQRLFFELEEAYSSVQISLINLHGQVLATEEFTDVPVNQSIGWRIPAFQPGLYVVQIIAGDEVISQKVRVW